ncbi:MAG: DUF6599 family protein [Pseudomonadota bacterium]
MGKKIFIYVAVVFVVTILFAMGSGGISEGRSASQKEALRSLLPLDKESAGWTLSSHPTFFEPESLWNHIDGQAEIYLDYGFKLLVTAEYSSPDDSKSVGIEIYEMETPHHAFGIYAAERSPQDHFIEMGVQGYLGENILNFWKGRYYIKLMSSQTSADTGEILRKLARVMAGKIKGDYSEPELFAFFPEKDRVRMSERFIPKNFLGHPFLKNGYRVDYKGGEGRYQLFLLKHGSPSEADDAFKRFQGFFGSDSSKGSVVKKAGYQALIIKENKGKAFFQYGSFMGGVLELEDLSKAAGIIESMVERLRDRPR